jgi:hypothetical protein
VLTSDSDPEIIDDSDKRAPEPGTTEKVNSSIDVQMEGAQTRMEMGGGGRAGDGGNADVKR